MVFSTDVGLKIFKKLSDIYQKSARKLSITKKLSENSHKCVRILSETVKCKYLSELY